VDGITGKTTRDLRVSMVSAPGFGGTISTGAVSLPRFAEATRPHCANDKVRA